MYRWYLPPVHMLLQLVVCHSHHRQILFDRYLQWCKRNTHIEQSEDVLSASNSDPGVILCLKTASLRCSSPSFPTWASVSCCIGFGAVAIALHALCAITECLEADVLVHNGLLKSATFISGGSGRLCRKVSTRQYIKSSGHAYTAVDCSSCPRECLPREARAGCGYRRLYGFVGV